MNEKTESKKELKIVPGIIFKDKKEDKTFEVFSDRPAGINTNDPSKCNDKIYAREFGVEHTRSSERVLFTDYLNTRLNNNDLVILDPNTNEMNSNYIARSVSYEESKLEANKINDNHKDKGIGL